MALQRKVTLSFGAAVCMLCVLGILSYRSIHQFITSAGWNDHSRLVLATIAQVSDEATKAESSSRRYVITGNEGDLSPYRAAVEGVDSKVRQLRELTADNPRQQQRLDRFELQRDEIIAVTQGTLNLRRIGGFEAAQRAVLSDERLHAMQELRKVLAELSDEEEQLLRERSAAEQHSARRAITVISSGSALALVLVAISGWKIRQELAARALAESTLRESEERFRLLVASAKEYAILMMDPEGRIATWNAGAQRIKGYEAKEIIGQDFSCFYPAEDVQRGKPQLELARATETGQYQEDGWRVRKNGSRFWASVLITCMRDPAGKIIGFSKITRDLTERMRAEEHTRHFFTLSLDLLCIAGADGYFKHVNPTWEATLGFTEAELLARPYLDLIHPDDRKATIAAAAGLRAGNTVIDFENRYRCRDGSYRWLTWKAATSADRQLTYAAARDITNKKKTEEAIAQMNLSLLRGNAQLEAANKELEAFSYSVSHDLRAPLRGIDGFSQAMLEDYGAQLDETAKDYLQRVRLATQKMGQLIDDMLNLSRVTRSEMKIERVDVSAMAAAVVAELQRSQPDRHVEVRIADGITASADSRLLRVVLDNLIGNAWKFTARQPAARIEVECKQNGAELAYVVRDNGAGFDMRFAHKLFGAFQRLHASSDFTGTGIGLATVQRVINRHGGRIWAEAAVDQGATFHFTLAAFSQALSRAA
ncbi:MAG TPA: PAS domain S-box protein [Tepidisphaeraceae bacterium]|nr:PAS domain S-box protein [Tepidisphaeraceae bacterium]